MKRKWRFLLLCAAAVAALTGYFFLLPAPAVGEGFQLLEVRQDGRDLTASLRPEQLADLEATMRGASRFRWKNPIGVYPLEADTVTLLGAKGDSVLLVGIRDLFAPDAVYIESWGPEYHGADKIAWWFTEWNRRGTVERWDIRQFFHKGDQTVVEWTFANRMDDGRREVFEGMTLVRWTATGQIARLQEFGCNLGRYDPYAHGPEPRFRDQQAAWF